MLFKNFSNNTFSFGILPDTKTQAINAKINENNSLFKLDLSGIINVNFPDNQYNKFITDKKQIVLHHTVSGRGVMGDINWWLSDSKRIATSKIIDWEGKIYQCFYSKYWAHHLGVTANQLKSYGFSDFNTRNETLNKHSIGVEIDAWGGLIEHKKNWYPAIWDDKLKKNVPNLKIKPIENVYVLDKPYRGFYGFEKYTDKQIQTLGELLTYYCDEYKIPRKYNEDMWDVSLGALKGESGIWSHTSYRPDKSDVFPQPSLIKMLKSL